MAYYSLQKIVLDRFPRNFFIWSAIVNDTCMQKIKIGHRAKFRDRDIFFPQVLFPFRAILPRIFKQQNNKKDGQKVVQLYFQ